MHVFNISLCIVKSITSFRPTLARWRVESKRSKKVYRVGPTACLMSRRRKTAFSCCTVLGRSAKRLQLKVVVSGLYCLQMQFLLWKSRQFRDPRDTTLTPRGRRRAALHWTWRRAAAWRPYSRCRRTILALRSPRKRCNQSSTPARSTYWCVIGHRHENKRSSNHWSRNETTCSHLSLFGDHG